MSLKSRLRTVFCCAVLEMGALIGAPMRPEQVRELMQALNQPKLAQTEPDRTEPRDGDGTVDRPWTS